MLPTWCTSGGHQPARSLARATFRAGRDCAYDFGRKGRRVRAVGTGQPDAQSRNEYSSVATQSTSIPVALTKRLRPRSRARTCMVIATTK